MKLTHNEIGSRIAHHYANEVGVVDEAEGFSPDALDEARGLAFADAIKAAGGYVRSHSNTRNPFGDNPSYIGVGRLWRRLAALIWRQVCDHDTGNARAICRMTIGEFISLYVDTDQSVWFKENGREVEGARPGISRDVAKEIGIVEADPRNETDRRNLELGAYPGPGAGLQHNPNYDPNLQPDGSRATPPAPMR